MDSDPGGWWLGRIENGDGVEGFFPSNFVQPMEALSPSDIGSLGITAVGGSGMSTLAPPAPLSVRNTRVYSGPRPTVVDEAMRSTTYVPAVAGPVTPMVAVTEPTHAVPQAPLSSPTTPADKPKKNEYGTRYHHWAVNMGVSTGVTMVALAPCSIVMGSYQVRK